VASNDRLNLQELQHPAWIPVAVLQGSYRSCKGAMLTAVLGCCLLCRFCLWPREVKDACPGSLWASSKRYAWFDLSANVSFYGPGPGGKGQVMSHRWAYAGCGLLTVGVPQRVGAGQTWR